MKKRSDSNQKGLPRGPRHPVALDPAKIRAKRAELQFTQEDAVANSGLSLATLKRAEAGQPILISYANALAKKLRCQLEDLRRDRRAELEPAKAVATTKLIRDSMERRGADLLSRPASYLLVTLKPDDNPLDMEDDRNFLEIEVSRLLARVPHKVLWRGHRTMRLELPLEKAEDANTALAKIPYVESVKEQGYRHVTGRHHREREAMLLMQEPIQLKIKFDVNPTTELCPKIATSLSLLGFEVVRVEIYMDVFIMVHARVPPGTNSERRRLFDRTAVELLSLSNTLELDIFGPSVSEHFDSE